MVLLILTTVGAIFFFFYIEDISSFYHLELTEFKERFFFIRNSDPHLCLCVFVMLVYTHDINGVDRKIKNNS